MKWRRMSAIRQRADGESRRYRCSFFDRSGDADSRGLDLRALVYYISITVILSLRKEKPMGKLFLLPCVAMLTAAAPATAAPPAVSTQAAPSEAQQSLTLSGGGDCRPSRKRRSASSCRAARLTPSQPRLPHRQGVEAGSGRRRPAKRCAGLPAVASRRRPKRATFRRSRVLGSPAGGAPNGLQDRDHRRQPSRRQHQPQGRPFDLRACATTISIVR